MFFVNKKNWHLSIFLFIILLFSPPSRAQSHGATGDLLMNVSRSVVRVVATGCPGLHPRRVASGFVWEKPTQVVTALHTVAGCKIAVNEQGGRSVEARIVKALASRDLALLQLEKLNSPALSQTAAPPGVGSTVWVIGFGLGQPTRDSHPLSIGVGGTTQTLREAVPEALEAVFRRSQIPALDTLVLRLGGNLVPGHSGAPIVDAQGKLVGVGSGGVKHGAPGHGWAVHARYVQELLQSSEPLPTSSVDYADGFNLIQPDLPSIKCGGMEFVFIRTIDYQTYVAGIKNQLRRERLLFFLQDALSPWTRSHWDNAENDDKIPVPKQPWGQRHLRIDLSRMRFDIWTERNTNVSIPLVAGTKLEEGGAGCRASIRNDIPRPQTTGVPNVADWTIRSSEFEVHMAFSGAALPLPLSVETFYSSQLSSVHRTVLSVATANVGGLSGVGAYRAWTDRRPRSIASNAYSLTELIGRPPQPNEIQIWVNSILTSKGAIFIAVSPQNSDRNNAYMWDNAWRSSVMSFLLISADNLSK